MKLGKEEKRTRIMVFEITELGILFTELEEDYPSMIEMTELGKYTWSN